MSLWPFLSAGDTIHIIAPSFACTEDELARASSCIRALGFTPSFTSAILEGDPDHPTQAGTSENIAADIVAALRNPKVKLLWAIGGGRLCNRVCRLLPKTPPTDRCVPILGYSDITALLCFVQRFWGWPCLHGPVLKCTKEMTDGYDESMASILSVLSGNQGNTLTYTGIEGRNVFTGTYTAPLWGGNLSLLQYYMNQHGPYTKPHIMIVETIDPETRCEDMLLSLDASGFFSHTQLVIMGQLHDYDERSIDFKEKHAPYARMLNALTKEMVTPFATVSMYGPGLCFGHGRRNHMLPLGTLASVCLDEKHLTVELCY